MKDENIINKLCPKNHEMIHMKEKPPGYARPCCDKCFNLIDPA